MMARCAIGRSCSFRADILAPHQEGRHFSRKIDILITLTAIISPAMTEDAAPKSLRILVIVSRPLDLPDLPNLVSRQ